MNQKKGPIDQKKENINRVLVQRLENNLMTYIYNIQFYQKDAKLTHIFNMMEFQKWSNWQEL